MSSGQIWDDQAVSMSDARRAAWASERAEYDWKEGQALCLSHLTVLPPSGDLLDLGAGVGRLTIPVALQRPTASLWAVDVSKRMLGHLSSWARRSGAENIRTRRTSGRHIPSAIPTHLAGAWSVLTFQHIPRPIQERYMQEVAMRLVPGAPLVVQFVEDAEPGPLSHATSLVDMKGWCAGNRLQLESVLYEARYPTWRWLTATKL